MTLAELETRISASRCGVGARCGEGGVRAARRRGTDSEFMMREVHDLTALSLVVCGEKKTRCPRKPSVKRAEKAGKTVARDPDPEPIGRDTPLRLG